MATYLYRGQRKLIDLNQQIMHWRATGEVTTVEREVASFAGFTPEHRANLAVARAKREETKRAQGKTLAAKQEAYSAAREQGLPPDKAIEQAGAGRGPSTVQRYERAWRLAREAAEAGERS